MNIIKKEAYKHILYCSLLEIRSGNNAPTVWNPLDWLYCFKETQKNKALADYFHNLAFFIREDFKEFDEEIFWSSLKDSKNNFYDKYKRLFDTYLTGEMQLF